MSVVEIFRHVGKTTVEREHTLRYAYQCGYEDCGAGCEERDNPYPHGTPEAQRWRDGWNRHNSDLAS